MNQWHRSISSSPPKFPFLNSRSQPSRSRGGRKRKLPKRRNGKTTTFPLPVPTTPHPNPLPPKKNAPSTRLLAANSPIAPELTRKPLAVAAAGEEEEEDVEEEEDEGGTTDTEFIFLFGIVSPLSF